MPRYWPKKLDEKEKKLVATFLRICSSKLTVSEIDGLKQTDLDRAVQEISEEHITFQDLIEMNGDEFYEYVVGQGRLFE